MDRLAILGEVPGVLAIQGRITLPGMRRRGATHHWAPDAMGLAWTILAAVVVMAPVLRPGVSLGSFDLLSRIGLTQHAGVAVHSEFPADQVLYFVPLTSLAWHQVHMGQLPLWNPYNVLGMPLAFSWQPGVFSVPVLLSYLAPVHYAYTVIVLSKLVIAGTGAYALCRVLGMGPLSAAFGGTVFELSGPMVHYAGWAMTGVTCWSGWIFGATILVVRGRHRRRDTIALAVAIALAIYGGHPESVVVLGVSLAVFLAVFLAVRSRSDGGAVRTPIIDLAVAGLCGLGLAAPLVLPGSQVVQASGRAAATGGASYPLSHLSDVLVGLQGTDFRVPPPYIGVVAVVLGLVGVRVFRRRAEILGFGAVAGVALVLTYQSPLYSVLQAAPVIGRITWNRDVMLLALAVAVLGAAGLEAVLRGEMAETVRRWASWGLVAMGPCRPRPFSHPYSTEVGIRPNANIGYNVHEFAIYEPVLPTSYYSSWTAVSGQRLAPSLRRVGLFCPQITTAAQARIYGVSYVLAPAHGPTPEGTTRDGSIGGEELFHVPGSAVATLTPLPRGGAPLPEDARGRPVAVTHPSAASWRVVTDGDSFQELRLRLTALPGWHATIDGRPLALERWSAGAMLEARVGPGRHVVEVRYWPDLFTAGLGTAALVLVGFAATVVLTRRRPDVHDAPAR
jgi:hypothetical protein